MQLNKETKPNQTIIKFDIIFIGKYAKTIAYWNLQNDINTKQKQ